MAKTGKPDMAKITKKRTKAPPSIVPAGDGPGLYRVRYGDGTLSDVVTSTA